MTQNSYLCRFIAEFPIDWEKKLTKEYNIRIKKEGAYAIFNYTPESDFFSPIVQEARGIIIDTEALSVVCWPFRKFGNYAESYADKIDWSNARVLEKVDGSIIKLWYDRKNTKWQFSTNGIIRAENAAVDTCIGLYFDTAIKRTINYKDIPFDTLNRDRTYIFELVSPETQVVIKYPVSLLYHIGTRSNLTGEEFDCDLGIKKPAAYPLDSLEACIKAACILNRTNGSNTTPDEISGEGFVVVDKNWNRVKVKSPDYILKHRLHQVQNVSKYDCIKKLVSGDSNVSVLCESNPHLVPLFKYYEYRLAELKYQASQMATLARNLYEEYGRDRKALASVISKHKLAIIGFRAVTCTDKGDDMLTELPIDKLVKMIPDYEAEDLSALFDTTVN